MTTDTANITLSINHPSENAEFIAKHRAAFRAEAPTALAVGDLVWIIDHYYPGRVVHVASDGHAIVSTPQWDYDAKRPMVRDGAVVDTRLTYHPEHYRQLRVDAASAEFWPSPSGWSHVESTHDVQPSLRDSFPSECPDRD